MVRSNEFSGFDEWVWALLDEQARSWVFWVRLIRFLGSSELVSRFGLFFLSPSLSLRAGAISLSLSSLSVFRKMIFEGKIKTEIILHPNTRSTEKHFRKIYFPCTTKHPHLRKSISESDFHPKQTQPKSISNGVAKCIKIFIIENDTIKIVSNGLYI